MLLLKSCFGVPLKTGAGVIAIVNAIASVCYIIFNIWQHFVYRGFLLGDHKSIHDSYYHYSSDINVEVLINAVTLTFLLAGFTLLFANCGLKHATLKNATHKIFLWLLVDYAQLGTIAILEIVVLTKFTSTVYGFIGITVCFILVDAILTYQLLVVHSYYAEEKLVEANNYTQLVERLTSTHNVEVQDDGDLQRVELNN